MINAVIKRIQKGLDLWYLLRETGSCSERVPPATRVECATLRRVDVIAFTSGIGENAAIIRARACRDAAWLSVELDEGDNAKSRLRVSASKQPCVSGSFLRMRAYERRLCMRLSCDALGQNSSSKFGIYSGVDAICDRFAYLVMEIFTCPES